MRESDLNVIIKDAKHHSSVTLPDRHIHTEQELEEAVCYIRSLGLSIVLTQGTFDLFHIGHVRYLRKAREYGDILIVGIDDDEKARDRKGENRPVVPLSERMEILTHTSSADLVVVKGAHDPKWHLIKLVHPDTLIAVEGTYKPEQLEELKSFAGVVKVLQRQAETSTSAKVRKLVLDGAEVITAMLSAELPDRISHLLRESLPGLLREAYQKMRGS